MTTQDSLAEASGRFLQNLDLATQQVLRDQAAVHRQKDFAVQHRMGALAASVSLLGMLARLRQQGVDVVLETPEVFGVRLAGLAPSAEDSLIVVPAVMPPFGP